MRIGGRAVTGPKKKTVVIPREDGDFVFHFVAVLDDDAFNAMYPVPEPQKTYNVKLGQTIANTETADYKAKLKARAEARMSWLFLESVKASNIEWDLVKLDDPSTFHQWPDDLKAAGFSIQEVNAIYSGYTETNWITEEMLKEARDRFLASQGQAALTTPSSPTTEPSNTPTGDPVNGSA